MRHALARVAAGNHSTCCGANVSTLSWNHTMQAGNDRLLVVTLSKRAYRACAVSSLTYCSLALSRLDAASYAPGNNPQV